MQNQLLIIVTVDLTARISDIQNVSTAVYLLTNVWADTHLQLLLIADGACQLAGIAVRAMFSIAFYADKQAPMVATAAVV